MKKTIIVLFLTGLLFSCTTKENQQLAFAPEHIVSDTCDNCPKVQISIPKALDELKIATTINTVLTQEISKTLVFEEEGNAPNIAAAIDSFNLEYTNLTKLYADETTPWEAEIEGDITYEDDQTISIALQSYIFTGGAHGYSFVRYFNFDKTKGELLTNATMFTDTTNFSAYAENLFRVRENIPLTENINNTGFMFENDTFHLPENIGFTPKGIQLHYNQYEVAPYSDGPITLEIPFEDAKPYLKTELQPKGTISATPYAMLK